MVCSEFILALRVSRWRCVSYGVVEGLHLCFVGACGICEGLLACMCSSVCGLGVDWCPLALDVLACVLVASVVGGCVSVINVGLVCPMLCACGFHCSQVSMVACIGVGVSAIASMRLLVVLNVVMRSVLAQIDVTKLCLTVFVGARWWLTVAAGG